MSELYNKSHVTALTYHGTKTAPDNTDQVGDVWEDIDPTYGRRRFKFIKNSGANTGAAIAGDVLLYSGIYGLVHTTSIATDSARNCVGGVAIGPIGIGENGWIQTDGYHAGVKCASSTFALGTMVMMSATDKTVDTAGTPGTAPTYNIVGTSLTTQSGNLVPMQLHLGKLGPNF